MGGQQEKKPVWVTGRARLKGRKKGLLKEGIPERIRHDLLSDPVLSLAAGIDDTISGNSFF